METVALHGQETKLQASEAGGAATTEMNLRKVAGAGSVSDSKQKHSHGETPVRPRRSTEHTTDPMFQNQYD